jgi:cysteine-rich repeat protein
MKSLVVGALVWLATVLAAPVGAVTFVVDSAVDAVDFVPGDGTCATQAGECTLRAAVQETNALAGSDTIIVPAGTYVLTLGLVEDQAMSGDLDVTDVLAITGAGAASTIIDGNDTSAVLEARSGSLALDGVTVQHGRDENGLAGGISAMVPITVTNCIVRANHGYVGGGMYTPYGVTLVGTTVTENLADFFAGGIAVRSGTIRDSTVVANALGPSAFFRGTDVACNGSGTLTIANSTIDEVLNFAFCVDFNCAPAPDVVLANVTAETLEFVQFGPGGSMTARNSIVVTNRAPLVSQGYNLIQENDHSITGDPTGNQIGVDPRLGPLADNGGPTPTRLLLPGSPAHDAANPAAPGSGGVACEATDQRGLARPIGPRCDVGAVESQCGDGVVQPEEPCDDGNQVNGDGCDVNCTPSACGNGVVAPGEQCDDGNTTAGDCCSPTCQFEPSGSACPDDGYVCRDDVCDGAGVCTHPPNFGPCSDGNPCTDDDVCNAAGICGGTPNSAPCSLGNPCTTGDHCSGGYCIPGQGCDPCLTCGLGGCVMPSCAVVPATRASLDVRQGSTDVRDKLGYRWENGPLAKSTFADPRAVTPRLCVYDPAGHVLLSALAPDDACPNGCWTDSTDGYRYSNSALDPDGISSMRLGAGNRGKVRVKGKGASLVLAGLPFDPPVRVRLLGEDGGACFGADFTSATRSTDTRFRARVP